MSKEKYFYLYKITNKINGKYYIGVHQTKNLEDGYMGSGKHLKRAINKHGIENFEKEILEYFDSKEEMYLRESEIVNEEFLKLEETYNLKIGGEGSWDFVNKNGLSKCWDFVNKNGLNVLIQNQKNTLKNLEKEEDKQIIKKKISIGYKNFLQNGGIHNWTNKKHREDSKLKMSITHKEKGNQQGEKNSCYGTCWIYNIELEQNKRIKKEELDSYLSLGWNQGMKMKFHRK